MRVLALDLATLTGWAVFEDGRRIASGVLDLDAGVTANDKKAERESERHARRAAALDLELRELLPGVDRLAYEWVGSGALRGSSAAMLKGALLGVMYANASRHECDLVSVESTRARKALLGSSRATPYPKGLSEKEKRKAVAERRKETKAAVIAAARLRWGPDIADDNEADALAVGLAAGCERVGLGRAAV